APPRPGRAIRGPARRRRGQGARPHPGRRGRRGGAREQMGDHGDGSCHSRVASAAPADQLGATDLREAAQAGTGSDLGAFAGLDQEQGDAVTEDDEMGLNETKRDQLRRKVAESQAALTRPQLPEREPPEGYRALAMDYPFTLVLGGLAVGAIVGAMLPRSAARKLGRAAIAAAGVAGELGMAYGRQAMDAAGELTDEG